MMNLRALPKVCPSSRNSNDAAVGVDPGSYDTKCVSHLLFGHELFAMERETHPTRNNLFSTSNSSATCEACASSITVSSPFADILLRMQRPGILYWNAVTSWKRVTIRIEYFKVGGGRGTVRFPKIF